MNKIRVTPKIIAMYLPQFHAIAENDKFWGEGFTDWVTLRKATPLFDGHKQPVVPFKHNYYDLSKKEDVEWQCKIASEFGIHAFGVYHYWFNDEKNLLTKPAEILRDSESIRIKYFFTWDNCSWVRSWSNVSGNDWSPIADSQIEKKGPRVLVEYNLGNEFNWKKHYDYLKSHFRSQNYMRIDNKPAFAIINYNDNIMSMCQYWDSLAKKDGYDGLYFFFKYRPFMDFPKEINFYNYEPHFSAWGNINYITRIKNAFQRRFKLEKGIYFYDYDKVWKSILKNARYHKESNFFHGAFVGYDDSPRRGHNRSRIIIGDNPKKFKEYMKEIIKISKEQQKEYIFLTAWNEWTEGAFIEPDEINSFAYLNSIKEALEESN